MLAIYLLALAAAIGIVAGLRSMTAPAVTAWAAHLGELNLSSTPLSFMESTLSAALFSIFAVAEYVADKLPRTPNRTRAGSLVVRIFTGGLSGACLTISAGASMLLGAGLGGIGAVLGASPAMRSGESWFETLRRRISMWLCWRTWSPSGWPCLWSLGARAVAGACLAPTAVQP